MVFLKNLKIVLTEDSVEQLINGEELNFKLDDNTNINIRQSYVKDNAAAILNRPIKVINTDTHEAVSKHSIDLQSMGVFKNGS